LLLRRSPGGSKHYSITQYKKNHDDGKGILDTINEENCNFVLVLSDVVFPKKTSGPELIELIQKCNPSAKALLMTGYAEEDVVRSEEGEHLYPVLGELFTKDELAKKISGVLNDESWW